MEKQGTRRALLVMAALVIAASAFWGTALRQAPVPQKYALPVLMYHHLVADGEPCNEMTVTSGRMEEDLRWLRDNGYHTVLPRELADGEELSKKPVMLTFDDGYRSNYQLLYPLLEKYQMKAAITVIPCMQDLDADNFLSWDMCREMTDSGLVEIGSHTHHLHNLGERGGCFDPDGINGIQRDPAESDEEFRARVLDDIQKSYDRITWEVGRPTFFAYPFGVVEPEAEDLIGELFPVTAITRPGVTDLRKGTRQMPRLTVTMDKSLETLLKKK